MNFLLSTKVFLIFILSILVVGCDDDRKPVIDAQYLAKNNCTFTGYMFEETKREIVNVGRWAQEKEVTRKFYIYECPPGNKRVLSEFQLKLEKVN